MPFVSKFTVLQRIIDLSIPVTETGCWLWLGAVTNGGYGRIKLRGGIMEMAHRVSYREHKGPIPEGLEIDHLCRVRCCVNPDHLEAVTKLENIRRGIGNGPAILAKQAKAQNKTHCRNGHEYTEPNTRMFRGMKLCRTCYRENMARWRAAHR